MLERECRQLALNSRVDWLVGCDFYVPTMLGASTEQRDRGVFSNNHGMSVSRNVYLYFFLKNNYICVDTYYYIIHRDIYVNIHTWYILPIHIRKLHI